MTDTMGNIFSGGQTSGYEDLEKNLKQAQQQIQEYYQKAVGYMQPFYDTGQKGMANYQAGLDAMKDPKAFYQKMMEGYNTSPQAQFQQQQAMKAANSAAAASGRLGGGAEQKALADWTQQLTARDQQQWYGNMLGINNQYLSGQAGLMDQGFNAGSRMGQWGMDAGQDMASLQGAIGRAQLNEDVASQSGWNSFFGSILSGDIGNPFTANQSMGGIFKGYQPSGGPMSMFGGGGGGGGGQGGGGGMNMASLASILAMFF